MNSVLLYDALLRTDFLTVKRFWLAMRNKKLIREITPIVYSEPIKYFSLLVVQLRF